MQVFRFLLAASLWIAPFASAQTIYDRDTDAEIKGTFPFNETIHIVQQAAVNGACGTSLSGPVTSSILNDTGFWSFDGKGNMSIVDAGVMIQTNPPTDASQVIGAAAQCVGTYHFFNKKSIDLHYKCSLDKDVSYFEVHSKGRVTPFNILVTTVNNADGSPGVTPYVYQGATVGCSNVVENTVVSLNLNSDW